MIKKPNCKDGKHWSTDDIYAFIENKFVKGYAITIVSGDIHKEIGLKDNHPMVCGAMKKLRKKYSSKEISTTNSEQSSTITVEYFL